jgi:hypothetical protein
MVSGHEFRRIGVEIGSGGLEYGREAIDAAIEQAVKRDRK